ncbi:MAG: hypothetical protein COB67_13325, partial [SAR324 cluster bacterium]
MFHQQIAAFDPLAFLEKLDVKTQFPCSSWAATDRGWRKIIAFEPVDSFRLDPGQDPEELVNFARQHQQCLLFGFLSYDLGYELYQLKGKAAPESSLPLIQFYAYDQYILSEETQAELYFQKQDFPARVRAILAQPSPTRRASSEYHLQPRIQRESYNQNFAKIQEYIKAGDIYQINYTHRLEGQTNRDSLELYHSLLEKNPVEYAAFIGTPDFEIISLSPESFIKVKDGKIQTLPIKGTRPRGKTAAEDKANQKSLLASEKEQAELFMIVDLLRNDLGKVCRT